MDTIAIYPQEVEVWYVLPTIRKEIAKVMKDLGLDQKTIAKHLGVTEAAISQYFSNKRGFDVGLEKDTLGLIRKSAENIINNNSNIVKETQILLKSMWKSEEICKIHHAAEDVPKGCGVCFEK